MCNYSCHFFLQFHTTAKAAIISNCKILKFFLATANHKLINEQNQHKHTKYNNNHSVVKRADNNLQQRCPLRTFNPRRRILLVD